MSHHQDLNVVVLHGKNPGVVRNYKTPTSNPNVVKKAGFTNSANSASLERRIDDGKITTPLKIPRAVSELIKDGRCTSETSKTQVQLAMRCNLVVKDIAEMENGSMDLTHSNKLKIRKVQQVLGLDTFKL